MLIALDREAFEHALTRWAEALLSRPIAAAASLPEAYALDGKSARGSFDGLQKAVHLLSLLAHESGLTLAQAAVPNGSEDKTNEHKAALRSLEALVLQGRLVTGDAIFCQRDFCRQVIDAEGDYLVFVKDNQPTLLNDIRMAFAPPAEGAFSPRQQRNFVTATNASRVGPGSSAATGPARSKARMNELRIDRSSVRVVHVVDLQKNACRHLLFRPPDTDQKSPDMSRLARAGSRIARLL